MSKSFLKVLFLGVICRGLLMGASAAEGASLEPLQGKWSAKGAEEEVRSLEINGEKLTFELGGRQTRFFAKGTAKAVQMGPFKVLEVSKVESGRAADELKASDERLSMVYAFQDGKLVVATNFDKAREGQKPDLIVYTRVESKSEKSKLAGNWKLDLELAENTFDYTLRIAETGGKLSAVLVSPRSGEHKVKTITFDDKAVDGGFLMEIDRELEGNPVTFVYTGKPNGEVLSGKLVVKGAEDQLSGTWTARKQGKGQ